MTRENDLENIKSRVCPNCGGELSIIEDELNHNLRTPNAWVECYDCFMVYHLVLQVVSFAEKRYKQGILTE